MHQKKGPPGSCPCHIAQATPGGSDGVTTDYLKGIRFFAERGLKQTVGGCASCLLHACSVPAPHVGPSYIDVGL